MSGMSRTGRGRGRARAEIAVVQVLEKRLGALPVVAEFGRRLRIAEIVGELAPVRPLALVTPGEGIQALGGNPRTPPPPMLRGHGEAAEVAQGPGGMTALRRIAGARRFWRVGDSKLISYTSAAAMNAQGVGFVAPLGAARVPAGLFAALPPQAGAAVDYTAGRDAGQPAAARGSYRVLEDGGMDLPGPRKADPPVHLRRILVHSTANATGAAKARARKLASATEDLNRLVRAAGTRFHPTADAVAARVKAITAKRRAGAFVRTTITHDTTGKPVLSWHFDQAAIDAAAAADGWYALLTNLAPSQASPQEGFPRYNGHYVPERRYGEFKGPPALAPLFLKTNRPIPAF